ncbi:MAG: hypothetical protein M3Z32_07885 [Acidobacteriota bacterium]|nr:hypothetical protein [Acidobacteriota bacterium]
MAKNTTDTHGVGTDRGGGPKANKKEAGSGGKGPANQKSATTGQDRPKQ